jgi:hypothetical protein
MSMRNTEGVSHLKIQTTDAVPTVFLTKSN